MPDASVIIAAWNAERTIAAAISSALRQTGVSLEIIVADDASSDATAEIAAGLGDPRIIIVRNTSNGGPAAARNAALAAATGAWIAVLDADDTMAPGRLAALIGKAATHSLDIVADNMWLEPEGGRARLFVPESLDATFERVTFEKFCAHNRLFGKLPGYGYLKPVFRADFLRRAGLLYDTALRVGEDFNIVAEALAQGARYGRVRSAFYNYTVAAGSISHRLSAASARAMLAADDRFFHRYGQALTPSQTAALQGHRRSLREGAAFILMVDALKRRDWRASCREAWACPAALRHFDMPIKARLGRAVESLTRPLRQQNTGIVTAQPVRAWGARR
jgi:succinoglycan biosynthesis protein ExoO